MDELFKILSETIKNTINMQTQIEYKLESEVDTSSGLTINSDISGFMKLKTDKQSCFLLLTFPYEAFVKSINSMLGESGDTLDPELEETVMEFLNVCFGTSNPSLKEAGFAFENEGIQMCRKLSLTKSVPASITHKLWSYTSDQGSFMFGVFIKNL